MKERRTILRFRLQAVSNSCDTTASVKHHNSFGSAQEYLVSIYISKMDLLVGNIRVNYIIYSMRRPFQIDPTLLIQHGTHVE